MTFPPSSSGSPYSQTEPGLSPSTSGEVNVQTGQLLRNFTAVKEAVHRQQGWLVATDLKVAPYNMSADDETLIKSALSGLDTSLAAVDMTFINRLTGLW
jgi:hypothetical protein